MMPAAAACTPGPRHGRPDLPTPDIRNLESAEPHLSRLILHASLAPPQPLINPVPTSRKWAVPLALPASAREPASIQRPTVEVEAPGMVSVEIERPFESTDVLVTGSAVLTGVARARASVCGACMSALVHVAQRRRVGLRSQSQSQWELGQLCCSAPCRRRRWRGSGWLRRTGWRSWTAGRTARERRRAADMAGEGGGEGCLEDDLDCVCRRVRWRRQADCVHACGPGRAQPASQSAEQPPSSPSVSQRTPHHPDRIGCDVLIPPSPCGV